MKFGEWIKQRTTIATIISLLIIIYAVSSATVLLLALGVLRFIPSAYLKPEILVWYSIASFVLTALVSTYHLYTFIRRRKRRNDWGEDQRREGIERRA
jgi:membrane protein implicated in regulation of membrane protease activity